MQNLYGTAQQITTGMLENENPQDETAHKLAYLRELKHKKFVYTLSLWIIYFFVSMLFFSLVYLYYEYQSASAENKEKKQT